MPNWCSANYMFYAETDIGKKNLRALWKKLYRVFNTKGACTGVKSIIKRMGVKDKVLLDIGSDLRDEIHDVEDSIVKTEDNWHFEVQAELAWNDYYATRAFHFLITHFYSGVKMSFIAEECGEEYYVKHDDKNFYRDKYIVDISGTNVPTEGTTYLQSKEGLISYVEEFGVQGLDKKASLREIECRLMEELVTQAEDRGDSVADIYVHVHEFDEISFAKDYKVEDVEAA